MKKHYKYNKERVNNIKKARKIILFVTVSIIVMIGSALAAQKVFMMTKNAKASETEQQKKNGQYLSLEGDPVADDVAFVEKYLNQQYQGVMPDGADGKKVAYLTFDDGPSETVTPMVLDVLKEEDVKATFFIVGQALDKNDANKEVLKREVAEGHAIGNHTYTHNYKYLFPNRTVNVDNFVADIEKTNESLRKVLGNDFSTRAIRVPGGQMSWNGIKPLDDILGSKDYHEIDWNALSKDSEGKPKKAPELASDLIQTVKGREKAVILMHDTYGKEETAKALPEIIKYLKEQGYEFRTMK